MQTNKDINEWMDGRMDGWKAGSEFFISSAAHDYFIHLLSLDSIVVANSELLIQTEM